MIEVRLSGKTLLVLVGFLRDPVGALDQLAVGDGVVLRQLFQQPFKRDGGFGRFHGLHFTTRMGYGVILLFCPDTATVFERRG